MADTQDVKVKTITYKNGGGTGMLDRNGQFQHVSLQLQLTRNSIIGNMYLQEIVIKNLANQVIK